MRCRLSVSSFVLSLRIASIQFCGLLNAEGNAFWMLALPNWSMSLRACAKRRFQTWSAKGYTTACTHAIYGVKQARDETRTQICMEQDTTAPNGVARARIFASNSSTRNRRTSNWYRLTVILFHLLNLFIHKLRDWGHTHNILRNERKKQFNFIDTRWIGLVRPACGRLHEAIAKVVRSRESSKWQLYKLAHTHSVVGMHSTTLENRIKRKNVMRCTCTVHS